MDNFGICYIKHVKHPRSFVDIKKMDFFYVKTSDLSIYNRDFNQNSRHIFATGCFRGIIELFEIKKSFKEQIDQYRYIHNIDCNKINRYIK